MLTRTSPRAPGLPRRLQSRLVLSLSRGSGLSQAHQWQPESSVRRQQRPGPGGLSAQSAAVALPGLPVVRILIARRSHRPVKESSNCFSSRAGSAPVSLPDPAFIRADLRPALLVPSYC